MMSLESGKKKIDLVQLEKSINHTSIPEVAADADFDEAWDMMAENEASSTAAINEVEASPGNFKMIGTDESVVEQEGALKFHFLEEKLDLPVSEDEGKILSFNGAVESNDNRPALSTVGGSGLAQISYDRRQRKRSNVFYKAKNHNELVKVGNHFYQDFKNGVRSFAISSNNLDEAQKKTIMGVASYFSNKEDLKILIVTNTCEHFTFKKLLGNLRREKKKIILGAPASFQYSTNGSFDLIEFKEFFRYKDAEEQYSYSDIIQTVLDGYDLVLWDVPNIDVLKEQSAFYFPLGLNFGQVSLMVKFSSTQISDIDKLKNFYDKYGIKVRGIIVDH